MPKVLFTGHERGKVRLQQFLRSRAQSIIMLFFTGVLRLLKKRYYLRENSIMCKRECKPCDSVCLLNNTKTITYQFISIPTIRILHMPMVITRIRTVTLGRARAFKVYFEVIFGNEELYFDFRQGTKLGVLRLRRPVFAPKHFLVKIQMKVFTARNLLSAKHWAYVDIDVSNYEF